MKIYKALSCCLFFLFIFGVGTQLKAQQKDKFGKYYAYIVGINDYKGSTWSPLGNAVNDAKELENVLKTKYNFDEVMTLYDKEATRANILQDLANICSRMNENDNLLVYYSGHGIEISGEGYWVPSDAKTDGTYALVSNNDVKNEIGKSKSKHTLLIVDACFSATIFREATEKPFYKESTANYYEKINELASRQAVTSGGLEPVPDKKGNICDGKHSVFACYLLRTLKENKEPYMDVSELFQKIKFPVSRNATMPRFGYIRGLGDEGGQFVFKTAPAKKTTTSGKKESTVSENTKNYYGIATGSSSGTYIVFGRDIKKMADKKILLKVLETKGSKDNFDRLLDGANGVNFAIVQYDVLQSEDKSKLFRKNKSEDIKMIFPLYAEEIHILARKDSEIKTFKDLEGKRVAIGEKNSGTWISMENLKKKMGVKWTGVEKGFDDGLKDLTAGKVDALIYVAGSPTKKLGNLSAGASQFIKLIPIPKDDNLSKIYTPTVIKADTYSWIEEDVTTYSIKSILVAFNSKEGTQEYQAVSDLVKVLLTNLPNLKQLGHPKWKEVCPTDYVNVPWDMHPAAKEAIDIWKEMFGSCD